MSRSLNKVMLIGNLGNDPEVRSTSGGNRVASENDSRSQAMLAAVRCRNSLGGVESRPRLLLEPTT